MLQSLFQSLYGKGLAAPEKLSIRGLADINRFSYPQQRFSALSYPTDPGPHYRWKPPDPRDIKKGEIYIDNNITSKRPGTGISPMQWDEIIGQTAQKDCKKDELIEL